MDGERVEGLIVHILVGRDQNQLSIDATFGLTSTPDFRSVDKTYVPPSERKEITIPDPTYTQNETYTMSTLTIPEVEGVVWHSSHLGYEPPDDIVEPGEHQIDNAVHPGLYLKAVPVRGYYVVNGEDDGGPRWRWGRAWTFRAGIPITMPMPTGVEATTEDGVDGWIVRYPDVTNARYTIPGGWDSEWNEIRTVMSGDTFTPNETVITAEADPPYYVVNSIVGILQADGTILTD